LESQAHQWAAWDVDAGRRVQEFHGTVEDPFDAHGVCVDPAGRWIAAITTRQAVEVWNLHTGTPVAEFKGLAGQPTQLAMAPDGTWIACSAISGLKGTLGVWDPTTGRVRRILVKDGEPCWAMGADPSGRVLVSAHLRPTNYEFPPSAIKLRAWDLVSGQLLKTMHVHYKTNPGGWVPQLIWDIEWSPDGARMVTASEDQTLRLWDPHTLEEVRTFVGHTGGVLAASFTADGRYVASIASDSALKFWNCETGSLIDSIEIDAVPSAICTAGARILVGCADGTINVYACEIPPK
jgi:WD40 repeat protein